MPQLSLITVTRNAEQVLGCTLQSVAAALQKAPDSFQVEYILVDGASTDRTLGLLEGYGELPLRVTSEPDNGLYDAMNKGLKSASGKYVWFLNAGDEISGPEVLARLSDSMTTDADIYYSDALFVRPDGSVAGLRSVVTPHTLPRRLGWQDMKMGMKVCHQAFIVRKSLAPFYDPGNLSADLDWEIRALKGARKVQWLDFILCRYLLGGISEQKRLKSLKDRWIVLKNHFGVLTALVSHFRILIRGIGFLARKGKYW